jgi:uncharacterized membrane protein
MITGTSAGRSMARRLSWLIAVLASTLALTCTSLAVTAPAASASEFCWGHTVTGVETCHGVPRNLSGDQGWGASRAICIGAGAIWGGCAPAGELKVMNLGFTTWAEPWISGNGGGTTLVYGSTF